MPKTMQDKETKDWIREQIEGIEAYDFSATTNGIMEAIGKIEQEAERRGEQRVLKAVYDCRLDEYIDMAQVRRKLKLLEEENGKQNAR